LRSTTVFRGGIAEVTGDDLDQYKDEGFQIKLLAASATAPGDLTCTGTDVQPGVYAGTLRFVVASDQAPGEYNVVVCSPAAILPDNAAPDRAGATPVKPAKGPRPIAIVGPLWVRALPLRITAVDPR
jgi:hypothetical protein